LIRWVPQQPTAYLSQYFPNGGAAIVVCSSIRCISPVANAFSNALPKLSGEVTRVAATPNELAKATKSDL
jgi:hypothetical protein